MRLKPSPLAGDARRRVKFAFGRVDIEQGGERYRIWLQRYVVAEEFRDIGGPSRFKWRWITTKVYDAPTIRESEQIDFLYADGADFFARPASSAPRKTSQTPLTQLDGEELVESLADLFDEDDDEDEI